MSEREVWMVERKDSSGAWFWVYPVHSKRVAEDEARMNNESRPQFEWRAWRYVAEPE